MYCRLPSAPFFLLMQLTLVPIYHLNLLLLAGNKVSGLLQLASVNSGELDPGVPGHVDPPW